MASAAASKIAALQLLQLMSQSPQAAEVSRMHQPSEPVVVPINERSARQQSGQSACPSLVTPYRG
jgi:hypothetical protein